MSNDDDGWVWTWLGVSFGYRDDDDLWTYDGRHVARINEDGEVYGPDGLYLGELDDDRLITKTRLKGRHVGSSFSPRMKRMSRMRRMQRTGRMMRMGHEEFPSPDALT